MKTLKVIRFSLGNNFAGLATALKANKCHFHHLFPLFTITRSFQVKLNIKKINLYIGKIGRKNEKQCKVTIKLILLKFLLQKDTRICDHT